MTGPYLMHQRSVRERQTIVEGFSYGQKNRADSIPVPRTSVFAGQSMYLDSLRKTPRRYQDNWAGWPTPRRQISVFISGAQHHDGSVAP